jgi:hypothetical protein
VTFCDRRWQLVLDCLGAEEPPFSEGTLVSFRAWLIERDLDRRLIERTVELAAATEGFGVRALRAALDSSPRRGPGRVEAFIAGQAGDEAAAAVAVARQVRDQDVDCSGPALALRRGVARDRRSAWRIRTGGTAASPGRCCSTGTSGT